MCACPDTHIVLLLTTNFVSHAVLFFVVNFMVTSHMFEFFISSAKISAKSGLQKYYYCCCQTICKSDSVKKDWEEESGEFLCIKYCPGLLILIIPCEGQQLSQVEYLVLPYITIVLSIPPSVLIHNMH